MHKYTRVVIRFGVLRRSGDEEFALIEKELVSLVEGICTGRHVHLAKSCHCLILFNLEVL